MFFANSLGPALTPSGAMIMMRFIAEKLKPDTTASADALYAIVSDFARLDGSRVSADAAIDYMLRHRLIERTASGYSISPSPSRAV